MERERERDIGRKGGRERELRGEREEEGWREKEGREREREYVGSGQWY